MFKILLFAMVPSHCCIETAVTQVMPLDRFDCTGCLCRRTKRLYVVYAVIVNVERRPAAGRGETSCKDLKLACNRSLVKIGDFVDYLM